MSGLNDLNLTMEEAKAIEWLEVQKLLAKRLVCEQEKTKLKKRSRKYDDLCAEQAGIDYDLVYAFGVDACVQPGDTYIVAEAHCGSVLGYKHAKTLHEAVALFDEMLPEYEHRVFSRRDLIAAYKNENKPRIKTESKRIDDVFTHDILQVTLAESDVQQSLEEQEQQEQQEDQEKCYQVTNAIVVFMQDEDFEEYEQGDVRAHTKALVRVTLVANTCVINVKDDILQGPKI